MVARDEQLPLASLRDLLGIVRVLYAAWRAEGVAQPKLDELSAVGRELRTSLDLARKTEPNTLGHRTAWDRAEEATQRLGRLISTVELLSTTIAVATKRALTGAGVGKRLTIAEISARKKHVRMRK